MPEFITRPECNTVKESIKDSIDRLAKQLNGQARDTNDALRTIVSEQREVKEKLDKHIGFHRGGEHTMEKRFQAGGMWAKWGAGVISIVIAIAAAGLFIGAKVGV